MGGRFPIDLWEKKQNNNKNIWGNHLSEHYCQNVVCWVINTEKLLENVFIYFGIKCITAQLSPNLLSATRTKKRWILSSCLTHMFITYEHWSASLWILSRTQRQVLSFLASSCEWQIKGKSLTFDPPHHMLLATLTSTWCNLMLACYTEYKLHIPWVHPILSHKEMPSHHWTAGFLLIKLETPVLSSLWK